MKLVVPEEVKLIAQALKKAKFQAYLVGGCVRDLLLDRVPKDWDVATNAKPDEVQKLFPNSVYENDFGTVGIKTDSENPKLKILEVTTFRLEGKYTDKRHPDEIKFAKTIEEDLSRRDFTVNALALDVVKGIAGEIIDPYGGQKDIKEKIIRTVGNAEERFDEDALRLMRAVRFAGELNFEIELNTRRAIEKLAGLLEVIAKERIRDEFVKIIMSDNATRGLLLLEELNLLRNVVPELREGIGVGQNKHHINTVFEHNIRALDYTVKKNYSLRVRLASLFHDVGKVRAKQGDGPDSTFYNHEMIGAKMTLKIMDCLRFPKDITEEVTHLVRNHLFYYNVDEVTAAGVRRLLRRVGPENVDDLMKVREADRIGSGVPKAVPYKLRHLLFMIEKVKNDPLSPKMLKVNGEDVMKILEIPPSPKVGQILNILLEEVLDDPELNTKKYLESEIKKLGKLPDKKLAEMMKEAKKKAESVEKGMEEEIKKKYYVK
ncbi:MAG: HD domain-containing protein [Candidatus Paceibacterota bacterium]|jgi:poly(A) polymerase/tRNA nucleotidyltransferase (CCA-adding enzyme)